ncbi:MAG: DUF2612 domain-containing protein [Clostridia bacterium]|nr:DUF2612 domain-containing protein [Clostridia bacterium]MBQ5900875.1 DUF2612 domain-containing protein [Clostridia bacterium]
MAYELEVSNVEEYYANLLILQYRNKPKARATVKLGADIYLGDGLVFELNDILNIDIAVGKQLDLIGQILGCNRSIPGFAPDTEFFSFEKENAYGYSDKNALSKGYWKSYFNSTGSAYDLQDSDYRNLLKFKAAYNLKRGSMGELDAIYYTFFGDNLAMTNNKDLTVTYTADSSLSVALQAAIFLDYIKPPMGISYTITEE